MLKVDYKNDWCYVISCNVRGGGYVVLGCVALELQSVLALGTGCLVM